MTSEKTPASTTTLIVLVIVTFFTALYMRGLNSGIPYYYDSIGYSATIGGTFVAVFTLASTVMRLIGGQLTDRFSHYKVLLVSLVIMLLGAGLPALFDNFSVAMGSRVLQGASFAVATNTMTVAVMGSASKKHIGRRLGIKGVGTSLGTMFGALVSTGLLDSIGYQGFYAFYTVLMVIALIAVLLLRKRESKEKSQKSSTPPTPASTPTSVSAPTPKRFSFRSFIAPYLMPQTAPFMALSFAQRIPTGFCTAFILVYAKFASIKVGATFFVVAGATTLLCRLLGGKIFDSDRTWLLFPLQALQVIGFIVFAITPSLTTLIIAAIGYGLSVGTTSPLIKALMAKVTPKEHWGAVNGELYFFADIGKALAAFCGGLFIDVMTKAFIPVIALGFAVFSCAVVALALLAGRFLWHDERK